MPEITQSLHVDGTVAAESGGTTLVLSQRLQGLDTFMTGQLQLLDGPPIVVRILTLDDVTVLRLLKPSRFPVTNPWTGILHLPQGWRARLIPDDLSTAAATARRDLGALDEAELRYALTFLGEASTSMIRQARIDAIIKALPEMDVTK